ncbi:MAG: hypothetical protein HFJ28_02305 [Clostridia bacterium]|nr:hypothetical protein [Clostridia bacterium]
MRALAKRKFIFSLAIWLLVFIIILVGITLSILINTYPIFSTDFNSLIFVSIIAVVCMASWYFPKLAHKLKKEAATLYQGANLLDKCSSCEELSDKESEFLEEAELLYEWLIDKN